MFPFKPEIFVAALEQKLFPLPIIYSPVRSILQPVKYSISILKKSITQNTMPVPKSMSKY